MKATVEWSWLSQDVRVRPDRYYILKAHARSDIAFKGEEEKDNAFLRLECLDKKNQVIRTDYEIITATSFWQQYMRQIYAPQGTNRIRIRIAKRQGEGSVWFDELQLEQVLTEAVLNQNFEILDKKGKLRYWIQDPKGGWSVDTDNPYEGENSMKATVGWGWLSQEIPVKPEEDYTLKAYLRSDIIIPTGEEDWNAFLALECLNKEGKIIEKDMIQLNIPYSWKPQIISVHAPEGTEKMRIKLAKRHGEGSVWFDNLRIVKLAWYMKIGFLQRIAKDKPFFIFYFAIYFVLLISLIRIILKR